MIDKGMKILDIISDYPEAEDIFKPYDQMIGKCVMCNHLFESVEEFCSMYGINVADLIAKLNKN